MAAMSASSGGQSWPDLPSDLLALVFSRLPSHADRVRLHAVCLAWRSSVQLLQPLPPLLPWLAFSDGSFVSLPDGAFYRTPVVNEVSSRLSIGGALFLVHGDDTCSLMDPSHGTTTPVSELAHCFRSKPPAVLLLKVVVSDRLMAALVENRPPSLIAEDSSRKVIVSTRGLQGDCSTVEWDTPDSPEGSYILDIALFKEKLYVLTMEVEHGQGRC